jgi:hypothetical protein
VHSKKFVINPPGVTSNIFGRFERAEKVLFTANFVFRAGKYQGVKP